MNNDNMPKLHLPTTEASHPTMLVEHWTSFFDETSGRHVYKDRFYVFLDAGSFFAESLSKGETLRQLNIALDHWDKEFATHIDRNREVSQRPEDLGKVTYVALSGEQYVNQLHSICEDSKMTLATFGYFIYKTGE
jgi:hypothetical protein